MKQILYLARGTKYATVKSESKVRNNREGFWVLAWTLQNENNNPSEIISGAQNIPDNV